LGKWDYSSSTYWYRKCALRI